MRWINRRRLLGFALLALAMLLSRESAARACPFCEPKAPTFSQRRNQADVVVLAELLEHDKQGATFVVRQVFETAGQLNPPVEPDLVVRVPAAELADRAARGQLALLLGTIDATDSPDALQWTAIAVNELEAAYFLRSPSLREPAAERLRYFVRYLEHADRAIGDDAYLEFAHAPFEVVQQVAHLAEAESPRQWIESDDVPDQRKGLYGLLLGIAPEEEATPSNQQYLSALLRARAGRTSDGSDFRPGFDGMVGGYLAASGAAGLDEIDRLFLTADKAAEGDLRHIVTALRFAHEYLTEIPQQRVAESMRHLVGRAGFTGPAIIDLARWRDAGSVELVAAQYDLASDSQPGVRRAVVGYLLSLQTTEAQQQLDRLRQLDPEGVAAAQRYFEQFGGLGVAGVR